MLLLLLLAVSAMPAAFATTLPKISCIPHDTKISCVCHNEKQRMLLPQLQGAVHHVEIHNCAALTVEANALAGTEGLRKISFKHVDQLVLHKYALSVPRHASRNALIVEFEQVNFELIDSHAIDGYIEEILFVGGRIERIAPFGLTITGSAVFLKLDGVTVQRIENQAFKKFAVEKMLIANCHFTENVPTHAFYELEVLNELSINNNRFQELDSHAFSFKLVSKLSLTDNRFVAVDGEWLEAHIRDGVVLRGNDFGATSEIAFRSLAAQSDHLELRFERNIVRTATPPQPLQFNERFTLSIQQLFYNNAWNCADLDMSEKPPLPKDEFFRTHIEQLYFRSDGDDKDQTADQVDFMPLGQLIEESCRQSRSIFGYIFGLILGLLALLWALLMALLWVLLMLALFALVLVLLVLLIRWIRRVCVKRINIETITYYVNGIPTSRTVTEREDSQTGRIISVSSEVL